MTPSNLIESLQDSLQYYNDIKETGLDPVCYDERDVRAVNCAALAIEYMLEDLKKFNGGNYDV